MILDTDGDGLPDHWEIQVFHTNPTMQDTDGDRFLDREEVEQGFNPLGKGLLEPTDADMDGLADRLEWLFRTDPSLRDSDGDRFTDGEEVMQAYSPTSSVSVRLPKSLNIYLDTQRLEMRVMNIPIKSFIASAGLPRTPTPVGTFKVLSKSPKAWSSSARLWMPYWMHFSGRGHGIHELPEWPNGKKEGADHLGRAASHGCVRLGIGSAKEAYEWSPIGTPVIVQKKTPKQVVTPVLKK